MSWASCPLLLLVFAYLFTYALRDLHEFADSVFGMGKRKHAITIMRVWMEEHGTSEMRDVEGLEQPVPLRHPLVPRAIEDKRRVVTAGFENSFRTSYLTRPLVLDSRSVGMLFDPVVSVVLFICKYGRGSMFAEASSDS